LRFVGASTAAVLMLLALMIAEPVLAPKVVSSPAVIADWVSVNVDGNVYAGYFRILAGKYMRIEIYASRGTNVSILIDIIPDVCVCFGSIGGEFFCDCGLDVEIVRPDGSIELPRYRLPGSFRYNFTARESGVYVMYLYNTFTETYRDIYVVIAGFPPPTTVERTVTETLIRERTVTEVQTATSVSTTTVTALTTLTVEREWGSMTTALSAVALAAAVIAIALALLLRRR